MSPFEGSTVIPAGWAARHGAVVAAAMAGECTITDGDTPDGWDPATGPAGTAGTVLYTGSCRLTPLGPDTTPSDAAGQPVHAAAYSVGIPRGSTVPAGSVVEITASPEDPAAVGQVFVVRSVAFSTHTFERVLTCTAR